VYVVILCVFLSICSVTDIGDTYRRESLRDGRSIIWTETYLLLVAISLQVTKCETKKGEGSVFAPLKAI